MSVALFAARALCIGRGAVFAVVFSRLADLRSRPIGVWAGACGGDLSALL